MPPTLDDLGSRGVIAGTPDGHAGISTGYTVTVAPDPTL